MKIESWIFVFKIIEKIDFRKRANLIANHTLLGRRKVAAYKSWLICFQQIVANWRFSLDCGNWPLNRKSLNKRVSSPALYSAFQLTRLGL